MQLSDDLPKNLFEVYSFNEEFVSKEDLPSFYNTADTGVWPGSASITIIEAMAVGLPIGCSFLGMHQSLFQTRHRFSFFARRCD